MRIAHLDVTSGAAGDMLLAALLDAGAPIEAVRGALDACGLGGEVDLRLESRMTGAFRAAHLEVLVSDHARPRQVPDALRDIASSGLSDRVRERSSATISRIAEVEARVHGRPVSDVHLHELSGADTLTDVVGFWAAIESLDIGRISASPINVGSGVVSFSHGRFGVPAPATAELLRGIPIFGAEDVATELTTPTGAALLATACDSFGSLPAMTIDRIGYSVGSRPTDPPQILRCYLGDG